MLLTLQYQLPNHAVSSASGNLLINLVKFIAGLLAALVLASGTIAKACLDIDYKIRG